MQSERNSLSGEDPGPRETKLEIAGGLEGKSLAVNRGLRVDRMSEAARDAGLPTNKLVPFQLPKKKLQTQRSQPA